MCIVSYWIDTLVLKLREILTLLCCITLSSSREKPTQTQEVEYNKDDCGKLKSKRRDERKKGKGKSFGTFLEIILEVGGEENERQMANNVMQEMRVL